MQNTTGCTDSPQSAALTSLQLHPKRRCSHHFMAVNKTSMFNVIQPTVPQACIWEVFPLTSHTNKLCRAVSSAACKRCLSHKSQLCLVAECGKLAPWSLSPFCKLVASNYLWVCLISTYSYNSFWVTKLYCYMWMIWDSECYLAINNFKKPTLPKPKPDNYTEFCFVFISSSVLLLSWSSAEFVVQGALSCKLCFF